jgi:hypothetical protein
VKTVDEFGTFGDALTKSPPAVKQLARSVRTLVSEVCPDGYEVPWPRLRVIGYGIGPRKSTEHFCYIAPYDEHVNLGFNHGLNLSDPDGMLEGGGKSFRHVKIRTKADVMNPGLKRLLREAMRERKDALRKK